MTYSGLDVEICETLKAFYTELHVQIVCHCSHVSACALSVSHLCHLQSAAEISVFSLCPSNFNRSTSSIK
jgi:hypothetical protein